MARVSRRLIPFLTLYLPHWFPAKYRAAIVASFMVAMPISTVIGAPISGALLGLRGIGAWMAGNGCSSLKRCRRC